MSQVTEADAVQIAPPILIVHGRRILLDKDLAAIHGVRTKRLDQQVRRNWAKSVAALDADTRRQFDLVCGPILGLMAPIAKRS